MFMTMGIGTLLWTVGSAAVGLVTKAVVGTKAAGHAADKAGEALDWKWLETTGEKVSGKAGKAEAAFDAAVGHTAGQTNVNWDGTKVALNLDAVPVVGRHDTLSIVGPGNTTLFNPQWRRQEDLAQEAVNYDLSHGIGSSKAALSFPLVIGALAIGGYALSKKR